MLKQDLNKDELIIYDYLCELPYIITLYMNIINGIQEGMHNGINMIYFFSKELIKRDDVPENVITSINNLYNFK